MQIAFRPARAEDFDYCSDLYFAGMEQTIRELGIDVARHRASFSKQWSLPEVRIITADGSDVGWLQSRIEGDSQFLAQLFIAPLLRRQGLGTQVMQRLCDEAADGHRPVTLGVVKTNPALRLYQRLGFQITHEDERKFYMRRVPVEGSRR